VHDVLKQIMNDADRWIGGTLLDFGESAPHRLAVNEQATVQAGRPVYYTPEELRREWPKRTKIRLIQVEESRYFAVIGENFGCNGDVAILRPSDPKKSEGPRYPCLADGEIALLGDRGHEWHLVPTWEP